MYINTHIKQSRSPLLSLHIPHFPQTKEMRGPITKAFKQGFLKNLLLSLQACKNGTSSKAMSLHERKSAIKSSADIAMAAARGGGARWPQALLASASSSSSRPYTLSGKVKRCKNIVRRCCRKRRRDGASTSFFAKTTLSSSEIARRLVKKRTKVLRRMIPGGELLDEISLVHEAMDYVVHLRAQVDVLRRISKAVRRSSISGVLVPSAQLKEGTVQVSGETENTL